MSQNNNTKRLTVDKVKTQNSYQNKLSPKEIKEKLEEYKKVEDISKVSLNSHLRYFTINEKSGEKQFRLGGFLTKIDSDKGYLILSNGNLSWSVQLKDSIFFQKMTFFFTPKCRPSLLDFPKLQAIEEQTLLHAPPQYQ